MLCCAMRFLIFARRVLVAIDKVIVARCVAALIGTGIGPKLLCLSSDVDLLQVSLFLLPFRAAGKSESSRVLKPRFGISTLLRLGTLGSKFFTFFFFFFFEAITCVAVYNACRVGWTLDLLVVSPGGLPERARTCNVSSAFGRRRHFFLILGSELQKFASDHAVYCPQHCLSR